MLRSLVRRSTATFRTSVKLGAGSYGGISKDGSNVESYVRSVFLLRYFCGVS